MFPSVRVLAGLVLLLISRQVYGANAQWNLNPTSGDWNLPTNWSPLGVPNGPADVATFSLSTVTDVFLSADVEVDRVVFSTGASAYTISALPTRALRLSGVGIVNNSSVMQRFNDLSLSFYGSASAGSNVTIQQSGGSIPGTGGPTTVFNQSANAGSARIISNGGRMEGAFGATTVFRDSANAGSATVDANGGTGTGTLGGPGSFGGRTVFQDNANAGNATITANGGLAVAARGGEVVFEMNANAGNANIRATSSAFAGPSGGTITFTGSATAGNASIIIGGSGGGNGSPSIIFAGQSTGGTARVSLGGFMDISGHTGGGIALDWLNGSGNIYLGANQLTLGGSNLSMEIGATIQNGGQVSGGSLRKLGSGTLTLVGHNYHSGATFIDGGTLRLYGSQVNSTIDMASGTLLESNTPIFANTLTIGGLSGSGTVQINGAALLIGNNNQSATYSGVVQGAGGLTKIGTGALTLAGANTYQGPTTVNAGKLIVEGSVITATTVNGGTLGGSGAVAAVTVNNGGALAPGSSAGILHVLGDLTLNLGATYLVDLNGTAVGIEYDQTDVTGTVTLANATLSLQVGFNPAAGDQFTIISNDGADAVSGTFVALPEGGLLVAGGQVFSISYVGGDGNDVVLAAVPEAQTWLLFAVGALFLGVALRRRRCASR